MKAIKKFLINSVICQCANGLTYSLRHKKKDLKTGGTIDAEYCYSVWMRHLVHYYEAAKRVPVNVVEFGPGDTIGIGLAALLSGCDHYYALDFIPYSGMNNAEKILDSLISMFRECRDIPGDASLPKVTPKLQSYHFPRHIFSQEALERNLSEKRIAGIRSSLHHMLQGKTADNDCIHYIAPWENAKLPEIPCDLIYSQAVMEHIDDYKHAYKVMAELLERGGGGYLSHQIDFSSHGCSKYWNGHWSYGDFIWKCIYGSRPYFLNRQPLSSHIEELRKHQFKIVTCIRQQKKEQEESISKKKLTAEFRDMEEQDFTTRGAYILAAKECARLQ